MARLQEEASAMDADSHGLTVLPFFSGGCGSGSGGNGGVGVSPTNDCASHSRSPSHFSVTC
jgi:hypothetical protein